MALSNRKPGQANASAPPTFDVVQGLAEQARGIATTGNPLTALNLAVRELIASEVDPYLLMGVLLESMVQTLKARIPTTRQPDTIMATLLMLQNRMKSAAEETDPQGCCDSPSDPTR
jgi:hypothetical protein